MAGQLKKRAELYLGGHYGGSPDQMRARAAKQRSGDGDGHEDALKGQGDGQLDKLVVAFDDAAAKRIEAQAAIVEHLQTRLGDGK